MLHHDSLALVVLLAVAVLAGATGLIVAATSRRRARTGPPARPEPRSVVHLLASGELREAVERASQFERGVAEILESRAARYESLLAGAAPTELRPVRDREQGVGSNRRSETA